MTSWHGCPPKAWPQESQSLRPVPVIQFPAEGVRLGWLWSGVCAGSPARAVSDAGVEALPQEAGLPGGAPQMCLQLGVRAVVARPGPSPDLCSQLAARPWASHSPPWALVFPSGAGSSDVLCFCSDGQPKGQWLYLEASLGPQCAWLSLPENKALGRGIRAHIC